ncbi:MAG: DUF1330 domain-containing protein [Planctomycetales bacterium]|nr:DUF1330 domain-containing protein [Planctomycetales bacterium]
MAEPDEGEPIFMLNALWFKPNGGEQTYREYLRAVQSVFAKYGGKKLNSYSPNLDLIGKFDADLVFFVEWPNWDAFQKFVHDEEFLAVRHLREEAIDDSLLIRCGRVK